MNEQEFPQGSVPVAVAARHRLRVAPDWQSHSQRKISHHYRGDGFTLWPYQLLHLPKASLRGDRIFVERRTTIMATEIRPELSEKNPYWIAGIDCPDTFFCSPA